MTRILSIATAGVLSFMGISLATPYQYLITDLGTLSGPVSQGMNLDAIGRVAGLSMLADSNFRAVLWNGAPVNLGVIGTDTQSTALGMNAGGQVVGISYNYGDIQVHAFLWQSGAMSYLGDFSPRAINAAGGIVGHRTLYNAANLLMDQAVRWNSGTITDLGTLGGDASDAFSINNGGLAVGQSFLADDLTIRACAWMNGTPHDMGTLAGTATAKSSANCVNDSGLAAGWSDTAAGLPHACLFQLDPNGQVIARTDLGVLSGNYSYAYSVNSSGATVGCSNSRGFIWQAGALSDLNGLIPPASGWYIYRAIAINDSGQILADGIRFGFTHALLLSPVTCIKGDVNGDAAVDGLDVQGFISALTAGGTPRQICAADLAAPQDGVVTTADIADFVQCLLSGTCG